MKKIQEFPIKNKNDQSKISEKVAYSNNPETGQNHDNLLINHVAGYRGSPKSDLIHIIYTVTKHSRAMK